MKNMVENLQKDVNEAQKRVVRMEEKVEDLNYVRIPIAELVRKDEIHDRKEARLSRGIVIAAVAGLLAVLITVAGFLFYMNQFDFGRFDMSQALDSEGGDAVIEDGINFEYGNLE